MLSVGRGGVNADPGLIAGVGRSCVANDIYGAIPRNVTGRPRIVMAAAERGRANGRGGD